MLGDRRIGNDGDRLLAARARGGLMRAIGQCIAEESPHDHPGHHHDDRDQRRDHTDADTASPAVIAVTAPPVRKAAVTAGRRRWRRSGRLRLTSRKVREVVRRVNVGGMRLLLEMLVAMGRIGVVEIP